jgi:hypothetical protein
MRLLELFSGTGSVGDVFREHGWEVVSVDVAPPPHASCDIRADILTLDPRHIGQEYGYFDCIWASPPCTEYSVARTTAKVPRNLTLADSLVQKAIDFIDELDPRVWFIENPFTGLLRTREVVQDLPPPVLVDYCKYGLKYRKRTAIWTNCPFVGDLCQPGNRCEWWCNGSHPTSAQRGGRSSQGVPGDTHSLNELHRLPRALCEAVERAAASQVGP